MLICNGRDEGSVTHEVLDSEEDLGSGGMLAAADRTPASKERLVPHGAQSIRRSQEHSEVQLNEKIIPTIADLKVTLVMGSRLRKLTKSGRESAEVSWDPNRKKTWKTKMLPRHQKSLESLAGAQEDEKIIPAIADSDVPLS